MLQIMRDHIGVPPHLTSYVYSVRELTCITQSTWLLYPLDQACTQGACHPPPPHPKLSVFTFGMIRSSSPPSPDLTHFWVWAWSSFQLYFTLSCGFHFLLEAFDTRVVSYNFHTLPDMLGQNVYSSVFSTLNEPGQFFRMQCSYPLAI